jgi:hypothetical protein
LPIILILPNCCRRIPYRLGFYFLYLICNTRWNIIISFSRIKTRFVSPCRLSEEKLPATTVRPKFTARNTDCMPVPPGRQRRKRALPPSGRRDKPLVSEERISDSVAPCFPRGFSKLFSCSRSDLPSCICLFGHDNIRDNSFGRCPVIGMPTAVVKTQ